MFSAAFSTLHRLMQQLQPLYNSSGDVNMKFWACILYGNVKGISTHGGGSDVDSRILF